MKNDDESTKFIKLNNNETICYKYFPSPKSEKIKPRNIILLHGNQLNKSCFEFILSDLNQRLNLNCFCLDMRGFGESTYINKITSISDFAGDVFEFIVKLKIEKPHILGFSLGGGVALALKLLSDQIIDKVILLAPVSISGIPMYKNTMVNGESVKIRCASDGDLKNHPYMHFIENLIKNNKKNEIFDLLKETMKYKNFESVDDDFDSKFNSFLNKSVSSWFDQKNVFDTMLSLITMNFTNVNNSVNNGDSSIFKLKEKILIIHGDNDRIVPNSCSKETKKILGNLCDLRILKNYGHNLLLYPKSDTTIIEIISSYLNLDSTHNLKPKLEAKF